jgi:hypothetical protein
MAATPGRNRSPSITQAASSRPAPISPSATAGQTRASHRRRAATSAAATEGGGLDAVPAALGSALPAPPGLLADDAVSSLPAETPSGFIDSPPALDTEPAESLTETACPPAEGRSPLGPVGAGEGFGAASVGGLAGFARGAAGTGDLAGGAGCADGPGFTVAMTGFAVDSTVSVAFSTTFSTGVAEAAERPAVSVKPTAKAIPQRRDRPNALPAPLIRLCLIAPCRHCSMPNLFFYPLSGQIYVPVA